MKEHKRNKKKVFKKWLFTYLFLSGISLIFIYSIHTYYMRSMKEDLTKLNSVYLDQVVSHFENEFRAIDKLVYTIGLYDHFVNIINLEEVSSVHDRYEIRSITNNLDMYTTANSLI